jgi:hypothetical protein
MASVYHVSPALVKKTEALLARVRRGPASEEFVFDWIARVDASAAPSQPDAAQPGSPEAPAGVAVPEAANNNARNASRAV